MVDSGIPGTQDTARIEKTLGRALLRLIEVGRQDAGVSDDLDASAQLLAEEGSRMLPGTQCRITVLPKDAPHTVRVIAAAGGAPAALHGMEWPLDAAPTGWAVESPTPVERTIAATDTSVARDLLLPAPCATLRVVPLRSAEALPDGRPILGAFLAVRPGERRFDQEERAIIDAYASLVAVALLRAELRRETLRLYAEAKSAAVEMSSFLDLVVHELRSPLTVVAGYLDLLRSDGAGAGTWQKPLSTMAAKVDEMQVLVRELVLSAQLSSGSYPARCTLFDLRDAVRRAVDRARPRAEMVEARLRPGIPAAGALVNCDPFHVDHILDNLINNAISYGGVRPEIEITVGGDAAWSTIVVSDRGPGISPELHERVFERFFRVNPLHGQAGTGLGLHISRQLAADCHGTLAIEFSEPEHGSRFVLRLPAAESPGS